MKSYRTSVDIDAYLPQFQTNYGYVLASDAALGAYIEEGRKRYLREWEKYIKENQN